MPIDYNHILREYDDGVHWEYPQGFDYRRTVDRFRTFVSAAEQTLGVTLHTETESKIQDASFHSQILAAPPIPLIRFSSFGNMVAMYSDDPIPADLQRSLLALFDQHGYIYIPDEFLAQPYTSPNPDVTSIHTWWIRYFDWL